jgi:cell division protein FtsQ
MSILDHDNDRSDRKLREPDALDPERILPGAGDSKGKARRLLGSLPVVTFVLFLLILAITGLVWSASHWKEGVTVRKVVVSGTNILSRKEMERPLQVFIGRRLDKVDPDEIRSALGSEPLIREMQISKELNGIVRVRIAERQPLAATLYQGVRMIIDTDGVLVPDNGISARFHRLPVVYGISGAVPAGGGLLHMNSEEYRILALILDAFSGSGYAALLLSEIHLSSANQSWFAASGSSIRFIIGNEGNFKEKLKKFEIFWQKVVAKKGFDCYSSVDLRFREKVFATEPVAAPPAPAQPSSKADKSAGQVLTR